MKKFILTLLMILFPISNLFTQWEILNEGLKGSINTIDFVNEDLGWLAGDNGTLLKTTDRGENWSSIQINGSWNISAIDFVDESIGWAIGGTYIDPNWINLILKTSDGGNTWVQQFSSAVFGYNSIYVIDATNVFAVGGNKIYKTTNGGTNWINVSPNIFERNYNSLWFLDSQRGVVVGNYNDGIRDRGLILNTTNGGSTWNQTIANEFNNIYDLQFLDNTNLYFRANNDSMSLLCRTEDMFSSRSIIAQSHYGIGSYHYIDNSIVYAIIADSITNNNIMKSIDGGLSWNKIYTPVEGVNFNRIYFSDSNSALAISSIMWTPALFRSTDAGNSWKLKYHSGNYQIGFFTSETNGFISTALCGCFHGCRSDGEILSTTDGGDNWTPAYHTGRFIKSFVFIDDDLGYWLSNCGSYTQIYKTTSGNNNWFEIFSSGWWSVDSIGYYIEANDMGFIDENVGFVVGKFYDSSLVCGAGILYTTDGGINWDLGWQYPDSNDISYNLNSITSIDTICWAVGEVGMIVKCTPLTGWVKQTSVTNLPLNKVFFSDNNHGWIAGGYQNENDFQTIFLKTTNGGVNWNTVPNIPYLFRDFVFIDNSLGWAIGYTQTGSGGILKTTDGGITWSVDTGNLPAKLNALHVKDDYGWAVGENGLVLRTTDAGAVWVEDEKDNVYPSEFVLEQNYPNPFNPNTTISWQAPISGHQTIKVFDVLGNKVSTLVDEYRPAGVYNVQFTMNNLQLSSGIYFYQLRAGEFVSTKKMILLK